MIYGIRTEHKQREASWRRFVTSAFASDVFCFFSSIFLSNIFLSFFFLVGGTWIVFERWIQAGLVDYWLLPEAVYVNVRRRVLTYHVVFFCLA